MLPTWLPYAIIIFLILLLIAVANSRPIIVTRKLWCLKKTVRVEYFRTSDSNITDSITFIFLKAGEYVVNFEVTPGHFSYDKAEQNGIDNEPDQLNVRISQVPDEKVINIPHIARNLRIRIAKIQKPEYLHDIQDIS